jgi:hypothetical protein
VHETLEIEDELLDFKKNCFIVHFTNLATHFVEISNQTNLVHMLNKQVENTNRRSLTKHPSCKFNSETLK